MVGAPPKSGFWLWPSAHKITYFVFQLFKLINNMAGNLGLWIGISAITLAEFLLVFIQIWLWCCTKTKELPDVPSLRYRNIEERSEREKRTGHTREAEKIESIANLKHDPNNPENMLIYSNNMAPKNFENELRKRCEFRKCGTTSD